MPSSGHSVILLSCYVIMSSCYHFKAFQHCHGLTRNIRIYRSASQTNNILLYSPWVCPWPPPSPPPRRWGGTRSPAPPPWAASWTPAPPPWCRARAGSRKYIAPSWKIFEHRFSWCAPAAAPRWPPGRGAAGARTRSGRGRGRGSTQAAAGGRAGTGAGQEGSQAAVIRLDQ